MAAEIVSPWFETEQIKQAPVTNLSKEVCYRIVLLQIIENLGSKRSRTTDEERALETAKGVIRECEPGIDWESTWRKLEGR